MADTELQQLIIYVGTTAQIQAAQQAGTITENDLAISTDAPDFQEKLTDVQMNAVNSGITTQLVSLYSGHVADTTIHVTEQNKATWNNKQDAINDLSTIRSNAQAGKSASDTVATYGNIVTHNVSEFATSAQGTKADSAIQGVKVNGTELTPDANKKVDVTVPAVNNATLKIQKNGTDVATFTANSSTDATANISVPTDTNDLTNGAGYITSSALNGYATETWVGQQGFLTSTALSNYVTTNTKQTITAAKAVFGTDVAFGSDQTQKNLFAVISNNNSQNGVWTGRLTVGAKDRTFILGTYGNKCVLGAHSWTNAQQGTNAAWEDVYINPDGDKAVYLGGSPINGRQALFKVTNVNYNTAGKVQVNRVTDLLQSNWKDVACWDDDVSKFANDAGYITGITSSDVTTALGYTPYDSSNPNGYTSNVGTVTSVNNVNPVNGNVTISIPTVDQSYDETSTNAQSGVAVKSAIDSAISSVYKPAGSVAFASLPALSSSIEGYVYNVTDSFTTTSDFVEGAGKTYPAGTNVVCIDVGSSVYKWDVLSGVVDLSGYVPTSRTINNKALTSNISLTASDVGALPDSTTIGNATLTIQKNGTTIDTFTANATSDKTVNVTVPTDTNDLSNGAGYITNSALSNYVTLNTLQTLSSGKKIFANDAVMAGNQTALLATISNKNTTTSDNAWVGRYICGAKNLTFLMGTYRTMAGIGAHTWTNAQTGAGAGWGDFYLNPDGDKTVYIGGYWWTKDSGWFKVKNSTNTGGKVQVNTGSISSANWKDVAYKGENVKDFSFTSISGYDSTKTQTLKHINGTLTWVDD